MKKESKMKYSCIYPNKVKDKDLQRFHPKCNICGGEVSKTVALSSGELWKDSKGKLYLSFINHDAATDLLAITKEGFSIASSNIAWPIKRCPPKTKLTIIQQKG